MGPTPGLSGRASAGRAPVERVQGQGWLPGTAERYRALSEQVPAVLYSEVDTPGGSVIYHSPQNEGLLGYTSEEAMQPGFWKTLVHPEDREWVLAEDKRCETHRATLACGVPRSWPRTAGWCGSATMPCSSAASPASPTTGRATTSTSPSKSRPRRPCARRWSASAKRWSASAKLERERQAARQLRALDEMKNTFLDTVSHELRTPLAAVIGIALTLQRAGSTWPRRTPSTWSTGWWPTPASWTGCWPTCWTWTG